MEDASTAAAAVTRGSTDKKTGDSIETLAARLARVEEGLSVCAEEILNQKTLPVATAKLVRGMDARIKAHTKLLDILRAILEEHGMASPRPKKGDPSSVN